MTEWLSEHGLGDMASALGAGVSSIDVCWPAMMQLSDAAWAAAWKLAKPRVT